MVESIRGRSEKARRICHRSTRFRKAALPGARHYGSRANQIQPFKTLSFAVTGRMVGGLKVLRQTISREDALIAHTRKNAYFLFQENNLGSIQPGKLADIVVLDRDYLTVPADQIKDIKPTMTIVGGRMVYDKDESSLARE